MYDKDIVMLQASAALIDPNEFLIHLLNKFGLLNWVRSVQIHVGLGKQLVVYKSVEMRRRTLFV